jgi:hypothetical protein
VLTRQEFLQRLVAAAAGSMMPPRAPAEPPQPGTYLKRVVKVTEIGHDGVVEHVTVYHRQGRFGGWPANHGIWSWGDEILVGFSAG